jgi:branched-chain amino acid aminotransferase
VKKEIDWSNLGFSYRDTNCHARYTWRNGEWDAGQLVDTPELTMHIAATALHYGQAAFEGLKAFMCRDGRIRLFRPLENARRMAVTARRVCMAEVPEELFLKAVIRVVREYVPPYGTGGALYIRPLLIGTGPQIGVKPAGEYVFLVLVTPVGPYYKGGLRPVRAVVLDDYDRAAPHGVGHVKVAGNYAAAMEAHHVAHRSGFDVELFLDAREHRYIDEFGTSNFVGVSGDGTYITPCSSSILPSVTNRTLQQLARDLDIPIEVRPVEFEEIRGFSEIGACGTAVVITPVCEIVRGDEVIRIGPPDGCGPVLERLYNAVTAIQYGEAPDPYDWCVEVG